MSAYTVLHNYCMNRDTAWAQPVCPPPRRDSFLTGRRFTSCIFRSVCDMMVRKMRRFPFGARTPDFRQESELINMKRSKCNRLLHRAALLFTVLVFAASTFAASASATEITPVPDPTTPVESTADPGVPGDSTVNPIIPNTDPNTPADPTVPMQRRLWTQTTQRPRRTRGFPRRLIPMRLSLRRERRHRQRRSLPQTRTRR